MSAGPYRLLLSLAIEHGYFAGGACRPLSLRPSEGCAAMLARNGMRARPLEGGVEVYSRDGPPDEAEPLVFSIENSDPYLVNYTALDAPAVPGPALWYADNRQAQDGLLQPDGDHSALERLALMPRRFAYPLAAPASVAVLDHLGRVVLAQAQPAPQPKGLLQLDLRDLPDGRYTLRADGVEVLAFYLSDVPAGQLWGAVALYAGGPQAYRIALRSRATFWRYVVIGPPAQPPDYERYSVRGQFAAAGAAIAFDHPPAMLDVGGRTAARFTSTEALPLCERPARQLRISLHSSGDGTSGATSTALPYAQRDVLTISDADAPHKAYSDIYVYL